MLTKINEPIRIFEETMSRAMAVFESAPQFYRDSNIIYKNCAALRKQFEKSYENFCKRFPRTNNLSRVRFTQEELDAYLDNSNRIVRKFI